MNSVKSILSLLLCAAVALGGCSSAISRKSLRFQAMDTFMQLDVYGADEAAQQIEEEILRLDRLLSVADEQSDVYRLNQTGTATVDEATADIAAKALQICRNTDGALDVTILPVVEEWGFISGNYRIPAKEELNALLQNVDYTTVDISDSTVTLPQGTKLDFGAVAKGYAADKAVSILRENKAYSAILNLGGTIAAYGKKPGADGWRVGIADPNNSADYVAYLTCSDKIIATSGSYERYFEGDDGKTYSHIIDPKTGFPVQNGVLSVTIISDNGLLCDALSTALFVMGRERAAEYARNHAGFDYVILTDDGKAYISKGIADSFTAAQGHDIEVIAE